MHTITIDIETLPADMPEADRLALVRDEVPANYKDPEKIRAWCEANADAAYRKTAFDAMRGRLLCIGYAVDDAPVRVAYDPTGTDTATLFDELHKALVDVRYPIWVGHNIAGFDLRWLKWHAWRIEHPIAGLIPFEKWGGKRVADTMSLWQGPDPKGWTKLGDIAAFLGIGGKGEGLDGSKVYDAWLAGEHDRIAAYCAQDVELTRRVYRVIGAGA